MDRARASEDGLDPKCLRVDSDHLNDPDLRHATAAIVQEIRNREIDQGYIGDELPSQADDDDDAPVATADDMQGIIVSFNKNLVQKLPANVDLFDDEEIGDTSDPRHKEELNPGG